MTNEGDVLSHRLYTIWISSMMRRLQPCSINLDNGGSSRELSPGHAFPLAAVFGTRIRNVLSTLMVNICRLHAHNLVLEASLGMILDK
jgi:hypothetical protein